MRTAEDQAEDQDLKRIERKLVDCLQEVLRKRFQQRKIIGGKRQRITLKAEVICQG